VRRSEAGCAQHCLTAYPNALHIVYTYADFSQLVSQVSQCASIVCQSTLGTRSVPLIPASEIIPIVLNVQISMRRVIRSRQLPAVTLPSLLNHWKHMSRRTSDRSDTHMRIGQPQIAIFDLILCATRRQTRRDMCSKTSLSHASIARAIYFRDEQLVPVSLRPAEQGDTEPYRSKHNFCTSAMPLFYTNFTDATAPLYANYPTIT
jgi:hypothetical protein